MGKRKAKSSVNWKLLGITTFVLIFGVSILVLYYGWIKPTLILCLIVVGFSLFRFIKAKIKRSALMARYGDKNLVREIEQGYFWKGQTSQQLLDALGEPDDVDEKVLKTKTKAIWKYGHLGGNRYELRITLDNLIVTGWDKKD